MASSATSALPSAAGRRGDVRKAADATGKQRYAVAGGYLRREETNAAILELSKSGMAIKQIARQTGHSRKLVRQVVRGERNDIFRTRQSSLCIYRGSTSNGPPTAAMALNSGAV
jgi:Mor family transcriptional regulator